MMRTFSQTRRFSNQNAGSTQTKLQKSTMSDSSGTLCHLAEARGCAKASSKKYESHIQVSQTDTIYSLAWAELYLALALLIADFDLVPEDLVRERDIDFVGDFFVGGVRNDSPGVRVRVRKAT